MDPSMIWARKQKQMVEGGLITHRNVFREMKKQNLQTEITMYFHKGTLSVLLPLPPLPPPLLFHLCHSAGSSPPLPPPPQPPQQEGVRNEDLHGDPLPLNE